MKPSELSEIIITVIPEKNIKNLFLKYFELSFDIKKFIDVMRINSGR